MRIGADRFGLTARVMALTAVLGVGMACIPPRPSPSPELPPTAGPTPSETAAATATSGVDVDPTLLDLLPRDIDGVPLEADADSAADIATQTTAEGVITPFVSGIAVARAFAPQATDATTDYVVVTLVRLRPGVFSGLIFDQWRETFDAAVCEQAGGVAGHAEADIAGHLTFIGTCAGGVHTHHVHLADRAVLLSLQGAGDGRFGERVIEGLTE